MNGRVRMRGSTVQPLVKRGLVFAMASGQCSTCGADLDPDWQIVARDPRQPITYRNARAVCQRCHEGPA